jgi:hypothetical protein
MKTFTSVIVGIVILAGCATASKLMKERRFDDASKGFRHAIRWSDFAAAYRFKEDGGSLPDLDRFKGIEVTSYEIVQSTQLVEGSQILEVAEIHYYKTSDMKERTLMSHLVWEYDEEKENWFLIEGWPDFE